MSTKAAEDSMEKEGHVPARLSWAEELRRVSLAVSQNSSKPPTSRHQLFYLLHWTSDASRFGITVRRGRDLEDAEAWWDIERALSRPPPFVTGHDAEILCLLRDAGMDDGGLRAFALAGGRAGELLQRLLRTGRLALSGDLSLLLYGEPRPGRLGWRIDAQGCQRPCFKPLSESGLAVPLLPPWYVDLERGLLGPLEVAGDPDLIARLFSLPPLPDERAALVAEVLLELAPDLPPPAANAQASLRRVAAAPRPVLRLETLATDGHAAWRDYPETLESAGFDVALPSFRYGDAEVGIGDGQVFAVLDDGETVRVLRRPELEEAFIAALAGAGLRRVPASVLRTVGRPPEAMYALAGEARWPDFMRGGRQALGAAGWTIEFDEEFRHNALQVESWEAELVRSENGWFDLDMGVVVEGERLPLAPLLASLFQRDARWLETAELLKIPDDEAIELRTPANKRLHVPAERLKPLAATLIDLFDGFDGGDGSYRLRVSRFDAQRLKALQDTRRWRFRGHDEIMALSSRLLAAQGVRRVAPPAGLGLELREYQKEGVAWLQFLREHEISGILADDMGLGKTAQALAHLLLEKEAGRLDRPALIVLPTSLVFNWMNEAARFAPGLSLLALQGTDRKLRFDGIPRYDAVLTTYPLLWRDAAELTRFKYHLLILDEAQTVKNSRSQGAEVVRRIDARHRLCLTGTPLENHLGELWSQFDFLLPGFLGDAAAFARYWRAPIEKQGDAGRRDLLARRIRPFILRRRKEEVAPELPPKTIILRKIELSGGQRDLYEAVRASMDVMVREEIASKGFGRSQIVILDALLKLRQVCCDPRLVKLPVAQKVQERAKLELLMTMLPELVDEGRRILVFSQFTGMLALIEQEMRRAWIDYALLTGDTADRESPVRRFQSGEVPVFLVSLKAGGVGLNLTSADTVIHYDPWWNPAVENQATDRAHRIGQDKPVFVYKLIVAGSIEEKILALQERKADLAAGILSADSKVALKFGEDDLAALFAPLPP
ncbi:MAG: helicase [Candidatus Accumulibacter sp.]|jgi:superfamily II DNA or RNA helicase|nr:helicase [Accumulibacter sp.]